MITTLWNKAKNKQQIYITCIYIGIVKYCHYSECGHLQGYINENKPIDVLVTPSEYTASATISVMAETTTTTIYCVEMKRETNKNTGYERGWEGRERRARKEVRGKKGSYRVTGYLQIQLDASFSCPMQPKIQPTPEVCAQRTRTVATPEPKKHCTKLKAEYDRYIQFQSLSLSNSQRNKYKVSQCRYLYSKSTAV